MNIQKVLVSQINPAPYNPRQDLQPGDQEYEKLKNSIENFGYVEPLVWNQRTGTLVSGHQRLKVLIAQGLREVDVSVVDLNIEKEKALNLALNKIRGDWDEDKLGKLISDLSTVPDFDMNLTGFDAPEVSGLLDGLLEDREDDGFDVDAYVESIVEPITRLGDVIELGNHRIMCGDSSKLENFKTLLGDKKINLLHTDPPYNVDYYGGSRPNANSRPANHKHWERIYSDNMTQEVYEQWLKTILSNIALFLETGAPVYIWNGHRQFGPMHQILVGLGFHISCVITWAKERFALGFGDYNQQTEFCLYGWKKENGSHIWHGPNNESTLWQINRDSTKTYIHPTQKPIAIAQRAIRNSSKRDDLVFDLFLGSGSTLIAAESLGRTCYGMELDPKYCDAIVRRYMAFAGEDKVSPQVRSLYLREVSK